MKPISLDHKASASQFLAKGIDHSRELIGPG
ncbi:MAG: hypothetical protein QOJ36_1392 [Verrucomicrobiota bacterium]